MKVTMLGSGTSSGVPRIGNDWGDCDPDEPRNRRRRVSVLVEAGDAVLIIDTGPDFREQMLSAGIGRMDAVLYTHSHADHTHGIDDLRQVFHLTGAPVQCWAAVGTWEHLKPSFRYVFEGQNGYPPVANANPIDGPFSIGPMNVEAFPQGHGPITSWGFRIEADGAVFCYSTDLDRMTEKGWAAVKGADLWIVDALRREPHPTHSHLERTLGWIRKAGVKRATLTHMDKSMDYRTLAAELPIGVEPGYDMLEIVL